MKPHRRQEQHRRRRRRQTLSQRNAGKPSKQAPNLPTSSAKTWCRWIISCAKAAVCAQNQTNCPGAFMVTTGVPGVTDQDSIRWRRVQNPVKGPAALAAKSPFHTPAASDSVPGVKLDFRHPHHDIYPSKTLAQLIHDMKNVNPSADVSA